MLGNVRDKIMKALKGAHILISRNCKYVIFYGKIKFTGVIKVMNLVKDSIYWVFQVGLI
jgi:hypothetical protein